MVTSQFHTQSIFNEKSYRYVSVVIRESPMAPRYSLEIMDRFLHYIMNNDLPFGGKLIIMRDFRQLDFCQSS